MHLPRFFHSPFTYKRSTPASAHAHTCAPTLAHASRSPLPTQLSSKKMKFFFTRYLAYARGAGDDELVAHVKEKAREWVDKAAAAD